MRTLYTRYARSRGMRPGPRRPPLPSDTHTGRPRLERKRVGYLRHVGPGGPTGAKGVAHALPQAAKVLAGVTAVVLAVFVGVLLLSSDAQAETLRQQLAKKQAALNQAYAELDALQEELDELAANYTAAELRLYQIESGINDVENEIALSEKDLAIARGQLEERLVSLYKEGYSSPTEQYLEIIFGESDIVSVLDRFSLVSKTAQEDQQLFEQVKVYLAASEEDEATLQEMKQKQTAQLDELAAMQEDIGVKISASAAEFNRIRGVVAKLKEEIRKADAAAAAAAEAARAAALAKKAKNKYGGPVATWKFVFPVDGPCSFTDTWGAYRSGGRTHKGTDVLAARGTPLVACVTGTISSCSFADRGLGGISIHIRGSNGAVYYYAHMDGIASGIKPGVAVTAGQLVGWVGSTGNAGTCNHLHFGMTLNGTSVNPYNTLRNAWGG